MHYLTLTCIAWLMMKPLDNLNHPLATLSVEVGLRCATINDVTVSQRQARSL